MKKAICRHVQTRSTRITLGVALGMLCTGGMSVARAETIPVDSPRWQLEGAEVADHLGRRSLWLHRGFATPKGVEIGDGVIDLDMAGSGARGFYGIDFRTQPNGDGE